MATAKKRTTKTSTSRTKAATTKPAKTAAKSPTKTPTKKPATAAGPKRPGPRADFGQPIDGFFAKTKGDLGAIAGALRAMIEAAAPDAEASLKWGMPFYSIGKTPMCAIGVHAKHVNLILSGAAAAYPDPDELLAGEGKTGRHLKLTSLADLPRKTVASWLATAAKLARGR